MDQWLQVALTVVGSGVAAYLAISLKVARHDERLRRLEQDVGTHETGIRGALHKHAGLLTQHELDIEMLKRRVE